MVIDRSQPRIEILEYVRDFLIVANIYSTVFLVDIEGK